jgi:hypothetical protein
MSTSFGKVGASALAQGSPWYPTRNQIHTPETLEITLRRILDQHYALANQVGTAGGARSDPPAAKPVERGPGPASTKLLGIDVEPVDTSTLADGATLKYSKARGTFFFG